MTNSTANIFDLLLGPLDPGAAVTPQNAAEGGSDLFGSILGELTGVSDLSALATSPSEELSGIMSQFADQVAMVSEGDAQDGAANAAIRLVTDDVRASQSLVVVPPYDGELPTKGATNLPRTWSAIEPSSRVVTTDQNAIKTTISPVPESVDSSAEAKAFGRDLARLLPEAMLQQNESVRMAAAGRQTDLQPGQYKITNSSTTGQNVQLDLVKQDASQSVVRVNLPLASLTEVSGVNSAVQRVTMATGDSAVRIESLLVKLNLTELEVSESTSDQDLDAAAKSTRVIKIVGDDGLRGRILRGEVPADKIVAYKAKPTQSGDKAARLIPQTRPTEPQVLNTIALQSSSLAAGSSSPEALAALSGQAITQQGHGLAQKAAVLADNWSDWSNGMTNNTGTNGGVSASGSTQGSDLGSSGDTTGQQHQPGDDSASGYRGRVELPRGFQSLLKHRQRQVLTLKIDPEHLGPARLILTDQGGRLRARVVVQTAEAKSLIENSLDRLHRQLREANLSIEDVDVALADDGRPRQFYENKPNWRPRRMTGTSLSDLSGADHITSEDIIVPPAQQYVGGSGVNILA